MTDMNNVTRHTLSVLVENAAGVLSQVSRLFSRKGYNIESLAVGTTDDPDVSRITIEVLCDGPMIDQIMNQLRKQFSVYSVQELKPERSIRRELVMLDVYKRQAMPMPEAVSTFLETPMKGQMPRNCATMKLFTRMAPRATVNRFAKSITWPPPLYQPLPAWLSTC